MNETEPKTKKILTIVVIFLLVSISVFYWLDTRKNCYEKWGEVYFVSDTDDIKPEIKAVGLIKDNSEALVIEVNTSNCSIKSVVRDYKPANAEELAAFQSILGTVSPVNSNRIVPVNLERVSNDSFEFSYYDGFYFNCCWSAGYATYFTNNQTVMWMAHTA